MMALFVGPLNFSTLVYISVITSTSCSSLEKTLKMNPRDFEYVLTWETENNAGMPTCFNVMYSIKSSPSCPIKTESNSSKKDNGQDTSSSKSQQSEDPNQVQPGKSSVCPSVPEENMWSKKTKHRTVMECSNITRSLCNLTREFTDACKTYIILVEQVTENRIINASLKFNPYLDICLGQPQFNISACPKCVNVSVKLSSPLLLRVYGDIKYTIKASTAGFPDKQDNNTTKQESFYAVMGNLLPNRNYCLTVDVYTSVHNKQCTPSPPKCIVIGSKNKSDHITTAILVGAFVPLLVVSVLLILFKVGFICLRIDWPNVLEIFPKLAYSVFNSVPEEVHNVKVIEERKKKARSYDNDDDDDSGSDAKNDGFYTVHKILKTCSTVDTTEQLSIDCSSPTTDTVEFGTADAESLQDEINDSESSTTSQIFYHSSQVSSTDEPELEHSSCLNVNLNSVKLGISADGWDVLAHLDPDKEDPADLKESCITDDSESTRFTDIPNVQSPSAHSLFSTWQNSSGSGESESSDSETDHVGDYIRR